ncbi:MAG TPA: NAD(P)-dependent oxidoreductase [Pseudolabrys sp.]|nr:NAD(P)-dependent oxidoreductase [Pseudolabrys sp.]
MKIALIGATGRVGSRVLRELLTRGHEVTAIARHAEHVRSEPHVTARSGNADDPDALARLLKGHDAVISAVRFAASDPQKLIEAVRASGVTRYLVVGGAGSLEVAPGVQLIDTPTLPDAAKPEAAAGGVFLDTLRQETELDWTFLSPSAVFAPGERTGKFRLGKDQLLTTDKGSSISFEDFAVALVDELEQPRHSRERFTVGY